MKILAVDDETTSLELMTQYLRAEGHEVVGASSGRAALDVYDDSFHLVLSDFHMPGMNGEDLFAAVRAQNSTIPFIYLTAEDDLAIGVELVRRGASDLIQKPVNRHTLALRIDRVMEELRRRREIEMIVREQEAIRSENQRLVNWRLLYASKDTRQTDKLVQNLTRNINQAGGFDWVDLLDEMKEELNGDEYRVAKAVVDLAISSARTHQTLIRRITEIGMLDQSEIDPEPLTIRDLAPRLEELAESAMRPRVERAACQFATGVPADLRPIGEYQVDWEESVIPAMLHELVSNAIKYSAPESTIRFGWLVDTSGSRPHLALRVHNTARYAEARDRKNEKILGIPYEYRELVFELFYTIDAFPTHIEDEAWPDGTGLYFVRLMSKRLGGWADAHTGLDYTSGEPVPTVTVEIRLPLTTGA